MNKDICEMLARLSLYFENVEDEVMEQKPKNLILTSNLIKKINKELDWNLPVPAIISSNGILFAKSYIEEFGFEVVPLLCAFENLYMILAEQDYELSDILSVFRAVLIKTFLDNGTSYDAYKNIFRIIMANESNA